MKLHQNHPSYVAYFRDLERELFVLDHGEEYGDNIFIETANNGEVAHRTTLAAIKIMAFDELMQADPISKLQDALDAILRDPMNTDLQRNGSLALGASKRFGKEWEQQ